MKRTSLVITSIALLITFPTQSYAATKTSVTKPKSAGRTVAAIPNTILSGTTPPSSAIGINGDFYIDVKNATIYGPKSKGKWLTPTSLRGLSGTNGVDGKNGTDAKNISNASTVAGPQGAQGEKGATGSIGATGSTGAQGPAGASGSGATGAKGDTGLTGSAGSSGTNGTNGTNGSAGAQGSIGLTGSIGPAGSTGAKGETGTVGSPGAPGLVGAKGETGTVGPSNVTTGVFSFISNLSGSARSSKTSNDFGGFVGGKKYLVHIYLKTYNLVGPGDPYLISMDVTSVGSTAVIDPTYFLATATEYLNPGERIYTTLYSELTIDGTGVSGIFNIQVTATIGTANMNVVLAGKYFGIEVGQIG